MGGTGTITLAVNGPTGTLIAQTSVKTHTHSKVFANCSVTIVATVASAETATFYLIVDGETGNETKVTNKGNNEYSNICLLHKTASVSAGNHTIELYGYCSAANSIDVKHCDLFGMGNLA